MNRETCNTCRYNYGLSPDFNSGFVSCRFNSIPNCLEIDNFDSTQCLDCRNQFYNVEGKCVAIEKFIPFCDKYHNRDTCWRCEQGLILSYDGTRCMNPEEFGKKPFNTCFNNIQSKKPHCSVCEAGFQFYRGECIECEVETINNGCLYCYGIDEERCLVCYPGYFMGFDGNCYKNGSSVPGLVV